VIAVLVAAFFAAWFLVAAVIASVFGRVVRLREAERSESESEVAR